MSVFDIVRDGDWRDQAACVGKDVNIFFPHQSESPQEALAMCRACPVRGNCLDEHLGEFRGIFGGLTERQRASLRNRAARAVTSPECGTTGGYHRHRRRLENPCRPCLEAKAAHGRESRAAKKAVA